MPHSTNEDKRGMDGIKKMLKFLDMVPHKYKVGPWSPVTHMVILCYACFLVLTMAMAAASYDPLHYKTPPNDWIQTYRLVGGIYGIITSAMILHSVGIWPLASYTLTSWNLMSLRLITAYLAGSHVPGAAVVADFLRFPALAGCSITVFVWWVVLVPLIDHLLITNIHSPEGRAAFWKWNLSPMLLNVHAINLPLVGVEFLYSGIPLNFFDLWAALLIAFLYCLFYLNVLDPRGLHFYIIFTPRTAFCAISYGLVLASYYGFYNGWNHVLAVYM